MNRIILIDAEGRHVVTIPREGLAPEVYRHNDVTFELDSCGVNADSTTTHYYRMV